MPGENADGSGGGRSESHTDSKAELAQQVGIAVRENNEMTFELVDTPSDVQRGDAAA